MLILSLLVAAYVVAGISFTLFNDEDLVLETAGRVVGLAFVVITFPLWLSRSLAAAYLNRSAA